MTENEQLAKAFSRLVENEYPFLDCRDYSVSIGKQELADLRLLAAAYIAEAMETVE